VRRAGYDTAGIDKLTTHAREAHRALGQPGAPQKIRLLQYPDDSAHPLDPRRLVSLSLSLSLLL
jgi:hypothetical protein